MSDSNILSIENVYKSYWNNKRETSIFRDLNLNVETGSINALMGVSGSGKTTFLNLVGGFDSVDQGKIMLGENTISLMDEYEISSIRNQMIGYIFQSFYLIHELSVLENIILPSLKKSFSRKEAEKKAMNIMKEIQIEHIANNFANEISGGEAQRTAIARALINDPDVILADEPTGNLDSKNRDIIINLLIAIVKKRGKSLIIATHDKTIADKCDNIYELKNYSLEKY